MCLQGGTTATGHGVILETKKCQDLTLHEGRKFGKTIRSAAAVVVVVAAAALAAAAATFCVTAWDERQHFI